MKSSPNQTVLGSVSAHFYGKRLVVSADGASGRNLNSHGAGGFSLTELLVVIAIMAMLAGLSTVTFSSFSATRGVWQTAENISELLTLARSEAVTRQTYVWAAFRETTVSGTAELQMVLLYSADGTSSATPANLIPLCRVVHARGAGLVTFDSLRAQTKALLQATATPVDLYSSKAGITYSGNPSAPFTDKITITFTPRGEAMLEGTPSETSGFDQMIGVGIVPSQGGKKMTGAKDDAAVILDGGTGLIRVLRL